MRKLTYKEKVQNDCELCNECQKGKYCPHESCLFTKIQEPKRIPEKIYKPRVKIVIDENEPQENILDDEKRKLLFPRKSIFQKYNVKRMIFLHLKGYMMVQIAQMMNLRPQVVGEVIRSYKKGELDVIL